ncbi:lipid II:glycine glycyltransferase FemX [Winogradskyella sp. R77965]|uniref:lipid II:glycine glycyltransferase FemX n=1 Tax=Winogradskyella sp. R77965 TaxID=3093872 RepID=UPI0037DC1C0D
MKDLIFTKDEQWLKKWDDFVVTHTKGSHLVLSAWLSSYATYGFDFEVGLIINEDEIVGGCGVVIPKFSFFKFYIIPHGPILSEAYVQNFNPVLHQLKKRAKFLKCCYAQISIPLSSNQLILRHTYLPKSINIEKTGFKQGKGFKHVYCTYGLNWLDINGINDESELLACLNSHARRNIKTAYRNNLILKKATTKETIKEAYELVELNARNSGYDTRSFNEVKESISNLIADGLGFFLVAYKDEVIKGSAFFIKTSGSITYLFGGTLKEKPDLKVGYFLHWEAVRLAISGNCYGYNISMGGSKGVLRFKKQFNTEQLFYQSPHYYVVINKPIFGMFELFEKYLKRYKKTISILLSKFTKN